MPLPAAAAAPSTVGEYREDSPAGLTSPFPLVLPLGAMEIHMLAIDSFGFTIRRQVFVPSRVYGRQVTWTADRPGTRCV